MHPILFHIGPFALHSYGVFVAMAFLSAMGLALREAGRVGEDPEKILDLFFYVLVAAIAGSRILYVVVNWPTFEQDPVEIVRIWHGGLVFYGGFIGAFIAAWWYIRSKKLSFLKTADILAPSIAFGQFVGRIGCFCAGCCYGKPSNLPWAVVFTDPESLAPRGIPLHPTQLYSSLNGLLIFALLVGLRRIKSFDGQLFWSYVLLYAVTRSIIEIFRGDPRGMFFGGAISTSQLFGSIMAAVAIVMLIVLKRRKQ
ncbi:MAG: prolipoprotein diacylglyceryl transferase [Deltaproteobacteria bacterium]|nr:MAG: prolipoprotein diacylglyceryl transferase [Deltaproteobacteria bacterium]